MRLCKQAVGCKCLTFHVIVVIHVTETGAQSLGRFVLATHTGQAQLRLSHSPAQHIHTQEGTSVKLGQRLYLICQRVSRDIIDLVISSRRRQDAAAVTYPA